VSLYYAYIVASRSRTLYVGITSDLMKRVWQHREGVFEGYSKLYQCNRLVWFEEFGAVLDAIAREKQVKGWRRSKKVVLIERENVTWADLSEGWGEMMVPFAL
jgi:putative endonuclease